MTEVLYLPQEVKNILSVSRLISKGAMMGATKNKTTFKKGSVSITLYEKTLINESTIFYFKEKRYSSEVLSPQEANRNMPEENKYQYGNDKKEDCQNKLGLPSEMDINVFHWYLHIREKLLHT